MTPHSRRIVVVTMASVAALAATGSYTFAQQPSLTPVQAATRAARLRAFAKAENAQPPPLLFHEAWTWKLSPYGLDVLPPAERHVSQAVVSNPNLELRLYGSDARDIIISGHEGRYDLWTGITTSPVAVTLRDKDHYFDLTGLARLRWITRTEQLHIIHPVIRLADGTLLVGSHADSSPGLVSPAPGLGEGEFLESEVSFDDQRWFVLDPNRVVTRGEVKNPDLSHVDEIGFADLMPGGGFGDTGCSNVSDIELFATAHKR